MAIREVLKRAGGELHKKYYGNFVRNKCDTIEEFSQLNEQSLRNLEIEEQDIPKILKQIEILNNGEAKSYETVFDLLAEVDLVEKYQVRFES